MTPRSGRPSRWPSEVRSGEELASARARTLKYARSSLTPLAFLVTGLDKFTTDMPAVNARLQSLARKLLAPLMEKVGWEASADDEHLTKLLRGTLIRLLSTFSYAEEGVEKEATEVRVCELPTRRAKRVDVLRRYPLRAPSQLVASLLATLPTYSSLRSCCSSSQRFAKFLEDAADMQALPSDMRSPVFKIILKNGGAAEFEQIKSYYVTATDNAEKKHVLNSLGAVDDVKLKKAVLDWTTGGEVKLQDFFYAIGSVHRSGKEGQELTWSYFKENFDRLKSMIGKASASLLDAVIVYSCGGFTSAAKADDIEEFFKDKDVAQNARKISQTVESMRANAKFTELLAKSEITKDSFWDAL